MKLHRTFRLLGGALCLAGSLSLSSCNFLDIIPPEQADLSDATQDADATLAFLYGCYSQIMNPIEYSASTGSADEYALPQIWGGVTLNYAYDLVINNAGGDQRWNRFYDAIGECHLFLRELPNARGVSDELKLQWEAEAKFLIAYYHFEVLRFYGPCPITDEYISYDTPNEAFPGRSHYDAVTNYIVDLLDEVIESGHLPINQDETNRGRATKAIACAVKARALLYAASPLWNGEFPYKTWSNVVDTEYGGVYYGKELVSKTYDPQKWERARVACQEALDAALEAGHALYTDETFYEQYENQTTKILDQLYVPMNEEVDDDFKRKVLMYRYMSCTQVREGNTELVWGISKDNDYMVGNCLMPHYVLQRNNGNWISGYEGYSPTLNSMENFYTKDGKFYDNTNPDELQRWANAPEDRPDLINLVVDREPRFYAWMAFDHGDWGVLISDGKPLKLEMKVAEVGKQGYFPDQFARDNCVTGFLCQKFVRPERRYNKQGSVNNVRFQRPLIRMAELYLNLAECYAMQGNTTEALKNLNMVHTRGGLPAVEESDLTSEHPLIEWVRNERFVEFYGEGQRYFDVRRWAIGPEKLGAGVRQGLNAEVVNPTFEEFNQRISINQPYKWTDRMYISPLYTSEVGKNTNLVQAPGY